MKNSIIYNNSSSQKSEFTSHGIGIKKVLINNSQCASKLMQAAIGMLANGEEVKIHCHPTMEEFFYFNTGNALIIIEGVDYFCEEGSFIKIPANACHSIIAKKEVQFTYWGVAI